MRKSGNFSNLEKSPNTNNDSTNNIITQFAASINSPAQHVNRAKTLFDKAYNKKPWEIHPTIIPFLTPMESYSVTIKEGNALQKGFSIKTAPVNHNKLNQGKAIQIVHTILGNAYQDENEVTVANQDFGNDACIIVGYNNKFGTKQPPTNKVDMKHLHPNEEEQEEKSYHDLFPDDNTLFTKQLESPEFLNFLKTDATTSEGQTLVAQYFKVDEEWASKKETNTVQAYFELLCLVKEQSTNDKVWISFWEGMHRHAAIIMTLLCADITYNTKNCYIPHTLQKSSFNDYIKGYTDTEAPQPLQIIQAIFDGTNADAKMLKTVTNVMAYIPQKTETDIATLMEVMRTQSQHVSENKLTSAARTLSTTLSDWLKLCSPNSVNSVKKKPEITHTFHLQTVINDKAYQKKKEKNHSDEKDNSDDEDSDSDFSEGIPECIDNYDWKAFLVNPLEADRLHKFTKKCLQSNEQRNDKQQVSPPYRITFKSITSNVRPISSGMQKLDVRHMNAYQIIPGIMYTLQARLHGVVVKKILNDKDIMRAIEYVTRYCYATRSAPFNTMPGACCDYGINWKQYLNSCEGDDEAIPVTVLLVSMYNACYTFQDDKRENLLILTLRGLEHGSRGTIPDKAFIRTFSEYTQYFHFTLLLHQIIYTNRDIFPNWKNCHACFRTKQIAYLSTSVMLHLL